MIRTKDWVGMVVRNADELQTPDGKKVMPGTIFEVVDAKYGKLSLQSDYHKINLHGIPMDKVVIINTHLD